MIDDTLVKYFEDNLGKGYSKMQITAFLLKQGYDKARVDAAENMVSFSPSKATLPSSKPLSFEKQGNLFTRSFIIMRASLGVIKREKSMLFFPLFAAFFSLIFIIAMIFQSIIAPFIDGIVPDTVAQLLSNILIFLIYLGLSLIATFFMCVLCLLLRRSWWVKRLVLAMLCVSLFLMCILLLLGV